MRPDEAFITTRKGGRGEEVTVFSHENDVYEARASNTQKLASNISEDLEDYLEASFEKPYRKYDGEIGIFHRRIVKNLHQTVFFRKYDEDRAAFHSTSVVLRRLMLALQKIYEFVEPDSANNETYGHVIREHLIHVCTEVEASWTGILRANGYSKKGNWTTRDYFKLKEPMRLDEHSVRLTFKPDSRYAPFKGWQSSSTTKTLPWYEAYNATKHDREENLDRATVEMATEASAAFFILAEAQFGTKTTSDVPPLFHSNTRPEFPAEEMYRRPIPGEKWQSRDLST